MNPNLDDPRLTAYALGELPPEERTQFEGELAASPELRAQLAEVQKFTKELSAGLAAEPLPKFLVQQRLAINAGTKPSNVVQFPHRNTFRTAALAAIAASIMAVAVWQIWFAETPKVQSKQPESVAQLRPTEAGLPRTSVTNYSVPPAPAPMTTPLVTKTIPEAGLAGLDKKNGSSINTVDRNFDSENHQIIALPPQSNSGQIPAPTTTPPNYPNPTDAANNVSKLYADSQSPASPSANPPLNRQQTILQPQPTAIGGFGGEQKTVTLAATRKTELLDSSAAQPSPHEGRLMMQSGFANESKSRTILHSNSGFVVIPGSPRSRYYYHLKVPQNTAAYPHLTENAFEEVAQQPLSTFSADVDGASYANIRRFLNENQLPPADAVRTEELLNYFSYNYPPPHGDDPFSINLEAASCPWNAEHRLVRVGIKARELASANRSVGNFVFLIDVSGSMEPAERLPLIKQALRHLVMKLSVNDRVAIVVYASEAGVKLPSTSCSEKEKILEAIDSLQAGGSTNGGDGIQQAYQVAQDNFITGGINRVLLCTDGDFNVGVTDENQLTRMIEEKAKGGVFLTTLGVGTDNYKDALMQKLADKGNGNYYYLDSLEEAQRVLIEQMNGTLVTVAKDVKFQVEFNPAKISAYRLIGYEKRMLQKQDFNNDAKDAGEVGAGHTVTALYEIVPVGREFPGAVDPLKYQTPSERPERYNETGSKELLTVKVRYKHPGGDRSHLMEVPFIDKEMAFHNASRDFRFAACVASFAMLLQDSQYKGNATYRAVEEVARSAKGSDESGYRSEFINLVRKAESLSGR